MCVQELSTGRKDVRIHTHTYARFIIEYIIQYSTTEKVVSARNQGKCLQNWSWLQGATVCRSPLLLAQNGFNAENELTLWDK